MVAYIINKISQNRKTYGGKFWSGKQSIDVALVGATVRLLRSLGAIIGYVAISIIGLYIRD